MKNKILKLRAEGKTYNEICNKLGCSKSTVAYYCGEGQKDKWILRQRKRRKNNVIQTKLERFKCKKLSNENPDEYCDNRNRLAVKCRDFQRRTKSSLLSKGDYTFNYFEVLKIIGDNPKCYLTGRSIDLKEPKSYNFDHVIPATRGGNNDLDNLGLTCRQANQAKADMTIEELFELCKDILTNNGYEVKKKD